MTTKPITLVDTTPAGSYELADAKLLIAAADHLIEFLIDAGHVAHEPLCGLIGAIRDKIDAAEKTVEAPRAE